PYYSKATGTMIPDFKKITLENVRMVRTPGSTIAPPIVTVTGYDEDHMLDLTLNNVVVEGLEQGKVKAAFANVKYGPGPVNFPMAGKGVTVTTARAVDAPPNPCADKFPNAPGR